MSDERMISVKPLVLEKALRDAGLVRFATDSHVVELRALLDAESAPCAKSQVEGKRERFQKWVMATKHPVFGFLDGQTLARGDDRTGYADEYVQGLWVAYLEFGPEQPAPVAVLPERLQQILKFLDGAENLDGHWFGEPHPSGRPYWWRNELRKALAETNIFAKPL